MLTACHKNLFWSLWQIFVLHDNHAGEFLCKSPILIVLKVKFVPYWTVLSHSWVTFRVILNSVFFFKKTVNMIKACFRWTDPT